MGTFGNIGSESRSDIVCLEGNGARPSHKGNGYSVGGAMYTLNSVEIHAVCYGLDTYNQNAEENLMPTIRTNGGGDCIPKVAYAVENHPNDSRVKLAEDDIVQALTSRMGTGGGNVPLVLFRKSRRAQNKDDFETWKEDNVTNTMNTFDRGDIRCTDAVVCKK